MVSRGEAYEVERAVNRLCPGEQTGLVLTPKIARDGVGRRWCDVMLAIKQVGVPIVRFRYTCDPAPELVRIGTIAQWLEKYPELAPFVLQTRPWKTVLYGALVAHVYADPRVPDAIRQNIRKALGMRDGELRT